MESSCKSSAAAAMSHERLIEVALGPHTRRLIELLSRVRGLARGSQWPKRRTANAEMAIPMSHSAPAPALSQVPLELSGSCVATTSRRSAGLKRSVLAGSRPPSALPTTSLGRSAHTNAPHEGCTHAGPGRTRRFRAQSQHRIQSVFMHGSAAKQPY